MIKRADSLTVKLLIRVLTFGARWRLMRWLPIGIENCRVQYDTTTWVRIYRYGWLA